MNNLYDRYPALNVCRQDIDNATQMIIDCYEKGGKLLLCGNGGSASDCEHIVGELMKGFLKKRVPKDDRFINIKDKLQVGLPAISLVSQSAILSAFANDVDPDYIYAQLVLGYAKKDDILLGLSTSGNSKNVVNAMDVAKSLGINTIGLTGQNESKISSIADITIKVPEVETYKVQELHLPVYHELCIRIEEHFFNE